MNSFKQVAMVTMTMVGFAGVAAAQPKDAKAPAPAKDAKAPAPAKDAKVADPKAPPPAAKEMPMPKPAAEIGDILKTMSGTWKCTGKNYGPDGSATDMTATMKTKGDLDGMWIHDTLDAKSGKTMKFHFDSYTTYDASSKKWRRVMVDSWGGQMVGTSDGMKDMKMDFAMDTASAMGAGLFKDHLDASDMKAGVKAMGEMSMDKGKSWAKVYEMTCKK